MLFYSTLVTTRVTRLNDGVRRQKLYSGVKFRSTTRQKTAKTLRTCKGKVVFVLKSGRNFTALSRKGRFRAKKRQKLYTGVKFWSESSAKFRSTRTHRLFPNNSRHSNSCKFLLKLPRIKDIRVIKAHDFIYAAFLHKQYLTFRLFVDILMNNTLVSRFE